VFKATRSYTLRVNTVEMSSMYHRSPARVKTLDILARATPFEEQTLAQLTKFCTFAMEESGATTASEAAQFLSDRYDWNIDYECDEFVTAWMASKKSSKKADAEHKDPDDTDIAVSQLSQTKDLPSRVYSIIIALTHNNLVV
jgi:hypothetical protein